MSHCTDVPIMSRLKGSIPGIGNSELTGLFTCNIKANIYERIHGLFHYHRQHDKRANSSVTVSPLLLSQISQYEIHTLCWLLYAIKRSYGGSVRIIMQQRLSRILMPTSSCCSDSEGEKKSVNPLEFCRVLHKCLHLFIYFFKLNIRIWW